MSRTWRLYAVSPATRKRWGAHYSCPDDEAAVGQAFVTMMVTHSNCAIEVIDSRVDTPQRYEADPIQALQFFEDDLKHHRIEWTS